MSEENKSDEIPKPLPPILQELKQAADSAVKSTVAPAESQPPPDWSKFKGIEIGFWQSVKEYLHKVLSSRVWSRTWVALCEATSSRFMLLLIIAGLAGIAMGADYSAARFGLLLIHAIIFLCSLRCLWILYMNRPESGKINLVKGGTTYQS